MDNLCLVVYSIAVKCGYFFLGEVLQFGFAVVFEPPRQAIHVYDFVIWEHATVLPQFELGRLDFLAHRTATLLKFLFDDEDVTRRFIDVTLVWALASMPAAYVCIPTMSQILE